MGNEIIIEAGRTEGQYWRDLFRYRELFYFLAWRDVLVRYKQTVIGILWAVLRPFLTMLIFVFIFGKIAKLPAGGMPYPVMVFAGLLPQACHPSARKRLPDRTARPRQPDETAARPRRLSRQPRLSRPGGGRKARPQRRSQRLAGSASAGRGRAAGRRPSARSGSGRDAPRPALAAAARLRARAGTGGAFSPARPNRRSRCAHAGSRSC